MGALIFLLMLGYLLPADPGADIPETGNWFGVLTIRPITYKIYLQYSPSEAHLFILNPKANEIPLDTLFFKADSLLFSRADFSSSYAGKYHPTTNTISGFWTDDVQKKHPLTFVPVSTDTLIGLRPVVTPYSWSKPPDLQDGLVTSELTAVNMDKILLDTLSKKIITEYFPNIQSLLIARDNKLVYEQYFYGFGVNDLWPIQSATKSITSALTGIALGQGQIKSLDDPLCNYLPEYRRLICSELNRDISIHQLLSMSTGLEWNELLYDYADEENRYTGCDTIADPMKCLFYRIRKINAPPVFNYNSTNHLVMNKILRQATSMRNPRDLRKKLLEPLGITRFNTWNEDFGVIGDISLTPRGMMKFGLLYLNEGNWNGEQIIPSWWVLESTSKKIDIGPREGYGYFWWTKEFDRNGAPVLLFYAWGYAGQYIFVVPKLHLVVVMTASNWIMDEKKYAFAMMKDYLLPACK